MKIEQWLIPISNKKTRPGIKRTPMSITLHETDNWNAGADAKAHARLQEAGNSRQASWQYQTDHKPIIYQSIPDNEVAWAGGDGQGPGNMYSIHIEMCVNADGDYKKTVENTAWLVRYLMAVYPHITVNEVYQHNKWSGKNCPRFMRSGEKGINWNQFLGMLKASPTATVRYPAHVLGIATITTNSLNMRKAPNTTGEIIGKAEKGSSWRVLEIKDGWYRIGQSAWISNVNNAYATYVKNDNPLPEEKEVIKVPEKTNEPDAWAKKHVEIMKELKITDGSKLHNSPTKQEVLVMISRALGNKD